jgi:F-type H+-transporting ATPase subunit delta
VADDSRYADVGGRYAQALFELADEAGVLTVVEANLRALSELERNHEDLRRAMASPTVSHEDKGRVLVAVADAAGCDPLTRNFLSLLAANLRAAALPAVIKAFERLTAARRGAVAAEVTSAIPLTASQAEGVAAALRLALGKDPEITTRVDPAILGGLKVRVGSRLFDSSLKSRLDHMKFALTRAP